MLRGGAAERCARCGCDLHQRPARSYAEMEGLVDGASSCGEPVIRAERPGGQSSMAVLIERWLWFAFLSLLLIFAIAALAVNAVEAAA